MKKLLIGFVVTIVVLVAAFYALNAYIYEEKQADPIPVESIPAGWVRAVTPENIEFLYPEVFPGMHVTAPTWPPEVRRNERPYACIEGERPGIDGLARTYEEHVTATRTYCVGSSSEGAAGSTYTTYEYSTEYEGAMVQVLFILRTVQCENYDEPQQTSCKDEQASFNLDAVVDSIVATIHTL